MMCGQLKQPPPILSRPKTAEDGSKGACVQLRTLCAFLLKDLLDQSDDDIQQAFENYGENFRDLYDNIITMINAEPSNMRAKHGISRINNIFEEHAGINSTKENFKHRSVLKCSSILDS